MASKYTSHVRRNDPSKMVLPSRRRRPLPASTWFALVLGLGAALLPFEAFSQTVLQQYREARFLARAEEILAREGMRAEPLPPQHVPSSADTLLAWWNRHQVASEPPPPPQPPPYADARWRHIRRLERAWYERSFEDVQWAFSGNARHTRLDTTTTPVLRALLEGRFGAPTLTLVEAPGSSLASDEYIQFEYWTVVNDSIPVRIMDVGGPLDRGVIVVSSVAYRNELMALRDALERELFDAPSYAPYMDYFYDEPTNAWYQTGFDGARYVSRRISRPALGRGRPWIESPQ